MLEFRILSSEPREQCLLGRCPTASSSERCGEGGAAQGGLNETLIVVTGDHCHTLTIAGYAKRGNLTGRPSPHHRFLLGLHLGQIDALAAAVEAIDAEVERDLGPFRGAVGLLVAIPGVADLTAQVVLSEIGLDIERFPSAGRLLSWPASARARQSASKRRSTRLKKGAPWFKTALVQAAWAPSQKHGYFDAQFQRLRARRRAKGHLRHCRLDPNHVYHMLSDGTAYADLGPDHFRRASHGPMQGPRQTDRTPRLHLLTRTRAPVPI